MAYLIKKIIVISIITAILLINLTSSEQQTLYKIDKVALTTISEISSPQEIVEKILPLTTLSQIKKSPYKELLNMNDDYVAWISISGTQVDDPIVKGSDNEYYLNRQFDKSYHKSGSIFMDYRNFGFGYSKNTVLYGHNMKDGTMFGSLKNFKDADFTQKNNLITIEDLYSTRTYQVFSSYFAKSDSSLVQLDFEDEAYELYIETIRQSSDFDYQILPKSGQPILTLITCSYEVDDGRYFIHAIEVTTTTP